MRPGSLIVMYDSLPFQIGHVRLPAGVFIMSMTCKATCRELTKLNGHITNEVINFCHARHSASVSRTVLVKMHYAF